MKFKCDDCFHKDVCIVNIEYVNVEQCPHYTPIADIQKIVRCKNCKHRYDSEFCECREPDAYCSDGEI